MAQLHAANVLGKNGLRTFICSWTDILQSAPLTAAAVVSIDLVTTLISIGSHILDNTKVACGLKALEVRIFQVSSTVQLIETLINQITSYA